MVMPIHDWSRVDSGIFHDVHVAWIGRLRSELNDHVLPEPFYALAEPVSGEVIPDVITLQAEKALEGEPPGASRLSRDDSPGGAVAVAEAPVLVHDLGPTYARMARRLVIRSSVEGDKIVAVIEIVSRANKDARMRVERFVEKSVSFLDEGIHLLIVDVQPATSFVPHGFHGLVCEALGHQAPALPVDRELQVVSYQLRDCGYPRAHVASLRVGDPLPEMPVFLLPHHFVRVPLEETYMAAFRGLAKKFRDVLEA